MAKMLAIIFYLLLENSLNMPDGDMWKKYLLLEFSNGGQFLASDH